MLEMTEFDYVIALFVFITGLCIGSFLNVVILRALSGESIVFPASKCPTCQTPLKWWHNIPVLSYIFLRAKCAFCKTKISIQYPIIELLTGYLFLMSFVKFGYSFNTIFTVIFISLFIVISTTDIKEHVSFDVHSYVLATFGLVYNFFNFGHLYDGYTWIFHTSFWASILGLILGVGVIGAYFGLGYLFFKTMVIGVGDIFIAGALGACFGWKYILPIIAIAIAIQVLMFIPVFIKKLICKKDFHTLTAFCVFVLITLVYSGYLNFAKSDLFSVKIFLNILLIASGIWLGQRVIASLPKNLAEINEAMIKDTIEGNTPKEENDGVFHMPFGPALCCSAIFFIFLH